MISIKKRSVVFDGGIKIGFVDGFMPKEQKLEPLDVYELGNEERLDAICRTLLDIIERSGHGEEVADATEALILIKRRKTPASVISTGSTEYTSSYILGGTNERVNDFNNWMAYYDHRHNR